MDYGLLLRKNTALLMQNFSLLLQLRQCTSTHLIEFPDRKYSLRIQLIGNVLEYKWRISAFFQLRSNSLLFQRHPACCFTYGITFHSYTSAFLVHNLQDCRFACLHGELCINGNLTRCCLIAFLQCLQLLCITGLQDNTSFHNRCCFIQLHNIPCCSVIDQQSVLIQKIHLKADILRFLQNADTILLPQGILQAYHNFISGNLNDFTDLDSDMIGTDRIHQLRPVMMKQMSLGKAAVEYFFHLHIHSFIIDKCSSLIIRIDRLTI